MVPNDVRGRVFATEFAIFSLASAVSSAVVGGALDAGLTVSGVIWLMAAFSVIPLAAWSVWLLVRGNAD